MSPARLLRPYLGLGAALVAAVACGTGEVADPAPKPPPAPTAPTADAGAPPTTKGNPCVVPDRARGLARLAPWLGGKPFLLPVELVSIAGSSAVYVAEMYGKVHRVEPTTGATRLAADLATTTMNEGGLRGFAVHPTKARAFVFVERPPLETEPSDAPYALDGELRAYDLLPDGSFDLGTEAVILRVHVPGAAHGADTLRFGPDGMLYVSVGDGRTSKFYVPPRYDATKLRGAILRIDVDSATPYAIPPDNPFVGSAEMREEVYAYGFRNPWKFSFDRLTKELWVGDVGETRTEEVNRVLPGKDYGWPTLEGNDCTPNAPGCVATGKTPPHFTYTHASGTSITGGFVYRGARVPALAGKYVYADYQVGGLFAVDLASTPKTPIHLNSGEVRPFAAALAEGANGELYVLDWLSGVIYTLEPDTTNAERPPFATKLSDTGCFDRANPRAPMPSLVPYDVNVELWSDGAGKERFLSLPKDAKLEAKPDGSLGLPPGGLLIKTFYDGSRPIETRFIGRQPDGQWVAATYEWAPDGTDATLLDGAKEVPLASGQKWTIPGPAACFFCHQEANGLALGLDRRQLDRPATNGDTENQLAKLTRLGLIAGALPELPRLEPIAGGASLEARARGYLHANCSSCHRPGVAIFSALDLRAETPFDKTGLCGACGTYRCVTPGAPATSLVSVRMHIRGAVPSLRYEDSQMPPIATGVVDPTGMALIDEWIRSGVTCPPP